MNRGQETHPIRVNARYEMNWGKSFFNKAYLRDLKVATGLVILLKLDSNHWFFLPVWPWPWWKNSKINRALLCYIKLHASFQSYWWIQSVVTVSKRPIQVKISYFFSCVTLKFDGWPWKTIGHLFYVHHFITIGEFKLELQYENTQIWPKLANFLSCLTLKFDRWPCKTIGHRGYHRKWLNWVWTSVTLTFDLKLLHGHHFWQ